MAAHAHERLGTVPPDRLTPEHQSAVATFRRTRGVELFGPFLPLLWSPELLTRTSALGEYLRHQSTLPRHLSELIILVAARLSSQPYEWSLHYPIALEAGVDRAVADAIGEGRRPDRMSDEEEILYDLSTQLAEGWNVSDATYARALARFGEKGVIEATGILGYYTMLAMILHVARTAPEPGGPPLPMRARSGDAA